MTIATVHTLTQAEYLDKRYEIIKQLEESGNEKSIIYVDPKGMVTIGVGFNATQASVLEQILSTGFELLNS